MFTGLVTALGVIERSDHAGDGRDLVIAAPWNDLALGESIAVNGACLTVSSHDAGRFTVHVVTTTLERTCIDAYHPGQRVNLERALRAGDRMGGHIVQGHVDGVAIVTGLSTHGDARLLDLAVPPTVAAASVPLGSITVDGVSLTVNALREPATVQVALIPFTLEHTTLGERRPGDRVHVEGDTVGKYVRQMMDVQSPARGT